LWCYDDSSFEKYDNYPGREYWAAETTFLPNLVVVALDCVTILIMMLWVGGKIATTYTQFWDVVGLLMVFVFGLTRGIGAASVDSDTACACATTAAFCRIFLMFLAFKPLRTGLDMTLEVLPSIWSILFLVALFLFSITALAFAMIHEQMGDNPVVAPTVTKQFLNYGVACQTMFYFLMKNGFPANMTASIQLNGYNAFVFITTTFVGTLFFLPMLMGSVVQAAKRNYLHALDDQKNTQLSLGLLSAYRILDMHGNGFIGYATVKDLVERLHKNHLIADKPSHGQFSEAVQVIDKNRDGLIDVREFMSLKDCYKIQAPCSEAWVTNMVTSLQENFTDKDYRQLGEHATKRNHFQRSPVGLFFYRMRRDLAAVVGDESVDVLVEMFFEPSKTMIETYEWKKLEDSNPSMAEAMLKMLGWGILRGPKNRKKFFVAPEQWTAVTDRDHLSAVIEEEKTRPSNVAEIAETPSPHRHEQMMELYSLRMNVGGENTVEYAQRVTKMLSDVDAMSSDGVALSEEMRITALVNGLPPGLKSKYAIWNRSLAPDTEPTKAAPTAAATSEPSYDDVVAWLENNADSVQVMHAGDLVRVVKIGSTHFKETAVVTKPSWNGRVKVRMMGSHKSKSYQPHELEHATAGTASAKVIMQITNVERQRRASVAPPTASEASQRAAKVAIQAAVHARVIAHSKNSHLVLSSLDDAIGHHLLHNRPPKSSKIFVVGTGLQLGIHLGSLILLAHHLGPETVHELLILDLPFIICTFVVFFLKFLSGHFQKIGFSPELVISALCVGVEIIPGLAVPDKTCREMEIGIYCLIIARFLTLFWILTRTEKFYSVERLVRKAMPTLLLVLMNVYAWMLVFSISGQAAWGGLIWFDKPDSPSELWCPAGTGMCATYLRFYSFNTMLKSNHVLYAAMLKGYYFGNVINYAQGGSDSDAFGAFFFFVCYWVLVGMVNMLLYKAIIFHSFWGESARLAKTNKWIDGKKTKYLKRAVPAHSLNVHSKEFRLWGCIRCLEPCVLPIIKWGSSETSLVEHAADAFHSFLGHEYEREVDELMSNKREGAGIALMDQSKTQA